MKTGIAFSYIIYHTAEFLLNFQELLTNKST